MAKVRQQMTYYYHTRMYQKENFLTSYLHQNNKSSSDTFIFGGSRGPYAQFTFCFADLAHNPVEYQGVSIDCW